MDKYPAQLTLVTSVKGNKATCNIILNVGCSGLRCIDFSRAGAGEGRDSEFDWGRGRAFDWEQPRRPPHDLRPRRPLPHAHTQLQHALVRHFLSSEEPTTAFCPNPGFRESPIWRFRWRNQWNFKKSLIFLKFCVKYRDFGMVREICNDSATKFSLKSGFSVLGLSPEEKTRAITLAWNGMIKIPFISFESIFGKWVSRSMGVPVFVFYCFLSHFYEGKFVSRVQLCHHSFDLSTLIS